MPPGHPANQMPQLPPMGYPAPAPLPSNMPPNMPPNGMPMQHQHHQPPPPPPAQAPVPASISKTDDLGRKYEYVAGFLQGTKTLGLTMRLPGSSLCSSLSERECADLVTRYAHICSFYDSQIPLTIPPGSPADYPSSVYQGRRARCEDWPRNKPKVRAARRNTASLICCTNLGGQRYRFGPLHYSG